MKGKVVGSRIVSEEGKTDGFLPNESLIRKLILWRTGCIPGIPAKCERCDEGIIAQGNTYSSAQDWKLHLKTSLQII